MFLIAHYGTIALQCPELYHTGATNTLMEQRVAQMVGRQLGRYEIQEEIGRGGMARVYRALDTVLRRSVALKLLAPQLTLDPEFVQRFLREARTAANLHHPAIVTIYDVGEEQGFHYIAMELIRGRTLHAVIEERGGLGLATALAILEPISQALDYAHTHGSVHRDIKPHNMMVTVEGRVLLTDFGIAQQSDSEYTRLTRTGMFMGTPEYMSPEQAEGRRVDGRSDLYSLGVVAYEFITGAVPFSGSLSQLILSHTQAAPPPLSTYLPDMPPELDLVLSRVLAKTPEGRFASAQAFLEALRIIARRYGISLATQEQLGELASPGATRILPPIKPISREPAAYQPPPLHANQQPTTPVGNARRQPPREPPTYAPPAPPEPDPAPDPLPAPPNQALMRIGGGIAVIVILVLALLIVRNIRGGRTTPLPDLPTPRRLTPTLFLPPTAPPPPPTAPVVAPTTLPTEVPIVPTSEPTEAPTMPAPPTEPPVLPAPTDTLVPATNTPVPPSVTPLPPSAIPTNTAPPTAPLPPSPLPTLTVAPTVTPIPTPPPSTPIIGQTAVIITPIVVGP